MLALLLAALALLLVLRRWVPMVVRYYRDAAVRRRQTERYAFEQLQKAIASERSESAYHALLAWLERLQPGMDARTFARTYGDASLLAAFDALSCGLYSDAAERIEFRSLRGKLAAARKQFLQPLPASAQPSLPPLNP
jgi:hypothetical protein